MYVGVCVHVGVCGCGGEWVGGCKVSGWSG